MKKIFVLMLLFSLLNVSCESEYDQMSEYEKVISEVGTNPNLSLDDVLKNTPIWTEAKVIRSSQPKGKGDVYVSDYEGEIIPDGGEHYSFVFGDKFRYYMTSTIGIGYQGYYLDYDYNIGENNVIGFENGLKREDYKVFGISFDKINVVAYSENRIVIDIYDNTYIKQPYLTFVLKSNTQEIKEKRENYCTDIATYEKALEESNQ